MQEYTKQKKGFTLIELVVVVLIIATLTAIAVPNYRRSIYRAEMTEGLTNGKTIFDATQRYRGINNENPTSFAQLDVGFYGSTATGLQFEDGAFTYILPNESGKYVEAKNDKAGYSLLFAFHEATENGVAMPILCCAQGNNSDVGTWLCNNVGEKNNESNVETYVSLYNVNASASNCREIK